VAVGSTGCRRKNLLKKYQVLSAMIALGQFTIPELAARTGVDPDTVETNVRRAQEYLKEVGTRPRTGRGRPVKEYRLLDEKIEDVRSLLEKLDIDLDSVRAAGVAEEPLQADSKELPKLGKRLPATLVSAKSLLLEDIVSVKSDEERHHLFRMAQLRIRSGLETLRLSGVGPAELDANSDIRLVRFLVALTKAELGVGSDSSTMEIAMALVPVMAQFREFRKSEASIPREVESRIQKSRLGKWLLAGEVVQWLLAGEVSVRSETPAVQVVHIGAGNVTKKLTQFAYSVLSERHIRWQSAPTFSNWKFQPEQRAAFAGPVLLAIADPAGSRLQAATRIIEEVSGNAPFVVLSNSPNAELEDLTNLHHGHFVCYSEKQRRSFGTKVADVFGEPSRISTLAAATASALMALRHES
jgi:hypothetical protein